MKVAIMQPYFFPYIGYFQLLNAVDRWIAFDEIQFIDKGWINRNRILHPNPAKEWQFITLPLAKRGQFDKICDISIKSEIDWRANILGKLTSYKNQAPYYTQTIDFVRYCFDTDEKNLACLVIEILKKTVGYLGIKTPIDVQSEMNLNLGEVQHAGQWALRISEAIGAKEYINPHGGQEIFKPEEFDDAKIKLSFLKAGLTPYQQKREKFVHGLSIVDFLMFNKIENCEKFLGQYEKTDIKSINKNYGADNV
jgi:hypothetical protein